MRTGYVICVDAVCEGTVPLVHDEKGKPFLFSTLFEAQCEIADTMQIKLQEFLDGQREFEDAISIEEYVLQVSELPDGALWPVTDFKAEKA